MNWIRLGLLVIALAALLVGCQDGPDLMENGGVRLAAGVKDGAPRFTTADNIDSATFNVYVTGPSDQTVNVHRITADWGEMTITWNNFGGAFDANVEGSFNGGLSGWKSVDVTDVVKGWADGTYDNYGLLLDQTVEDYPRVMYSAREGDYPPYLEICYEGRDCIQEVAVADAYIWESAADFNYGDEVALFTGWFDETSLEKQAVVRFELSPPQEGCTRTIGYWKNWTGLGPQPDMVSDLLPVTLGTGSGKSRDVLDVYDAVDYLRQKVYGHPSNGITKLYAQLLAAKLNIANGASGDDVAEAIEDADEFLELYDYEDWDGLTDDQRDSVMYWHGMFDDYNNGIIGPGHCDDELPDDDPPPAPGGSVGINIR